MTWRRQWQGTLDDSVEPWCFLILEMGSESNSHIRGWELGFGNPMRLTRSQSVSPSLNLTEKEVLDQLFGELDQHRYEGMTVITPTSQTLALLRTRVLVYPQLDATAFRGLSHFNIDALIQDFFLPKVEVEFSRMELEVDTEKQCLEDLVREISSVELIWNLLNVLGPWVPRERLTGEPL